MPFVPVTNTEKFNNTSLQGFIQADYDQLVKTFGTPYLYPSDSPKKEDAEWELETEDGEVITLYTHDSDKEKYVNHNKIWHIGGHDSNVVRIIKNAMPIELNYHETVYGIYIKLVSLK